MAKRVNASEVEKITGGEPIVWSPHLDDAVLSAWSVLRYARAARVVNICTGFPIRGVTTHWDRLGGVEDSVEMMRLRIKEDQVVLAQLHVFSMNLDFLDSQYGDDDSLGSRYGTNRDDLRQELGLELLKQAAKLVCAPLGLGEHPDHLLVRSIALERLKKGNRVYFYADIPYAFRFGWPDWVTNNKLAYLDASVAWESTLEFFESEEINLKPVIIFLSEQERLEKLISLKQYQTQFAALSAGSLRSLEASGALAYEVFWQAILP